MKRLLLCFGVFLLALVSQVGVAGASANDFTISDFQADYYLSKDGENHSVLKTTEQITAVFPEYDQNHGIERAIPKIFDGHSTSLTVLSVKDENGDSLNYTTRSENSNLILRIGDAYEYAHGTKTYVITYAQQDVTGFYSNTNDDEFYWDVNGTGWLHPFTKVTARLHLDNSVVGDLTDNQSCYYGAQGSSQKCTISKTDDVITASVENLVAGENMTIAVGFKPRTFTAYQKTLAEMSPYIGAGLVFFSIVAMIIIRVFFGRDARGKGVIIAEYLPPKDVSLLLAASLLKKNSKSTTAQILDLAVRYKVRIIESQEKNIIFNKIAYSLELLDLSGLDEDELKFVNILFPSGKVGDSYKFKSNDAVRTRAIFALWTDLSTKIRELNYRNRPIGLNAAMSIFSALIMFSAVFAIWFGTGVGDGASYPVFLGFVVVAAIVIYVSSRPKNLDKACFIQPLTESGRELVDYLKGLEVYIGLAEADRLRYLQSPRGALKQVLATDDSGAVVKLYERVLPYAVLFGQEKDWVKQMGAYYDAAKTNPDWYRGLNAFSAVAFASSINNFSNTINSYSAPTSSSGGGSFGGGFSGGGGGGGGGGGW